MCVRLEVSVKLCGKPLPAVNTGEKNWMACSGICSSPANLEESRKRGIIPQILKVLMVMLFSGFKVGDNSKLRFLMLNVLKNKMDQGEYLRRLPSKVVSYCLKLD